MLRDEVLDHRASVGQAMLQDEVVEEVCEVRLIHRSPCAEALLERLAEGVGEAGPASELEERPLEVPGPHDEVGTGGHRGVLFGWRLQAAYARPRVRCPPFTYSVTARPRARVLLPASAVMAPCRDGPSQGAGPEPTALRPRRSTQPKRCLGASGSTSLVKVASSIPLRSPALLAS